MSLTSRPCFFRNMKQTLKDITKNVLNFQMNFLFAFAFKQTISKPPHMHKQIHIHT